MIILTFNYMQHKLTEREKNLLAELLLPIMDNLTATPPMHTHDKELYTAIEKMLLNLETELYAI